VYYHTTRFYNKTLTFTFKTMSYCTDTQWAPLKIIIVVFVIETNTGYVGGFVQVQHYWGGNISRELLNPDLGKLRTIHWSHHVPATKLTPFVVSEDEGNTKEGPGKSMKNALHVQRHGKRHLSRWSDVEQWKNQVRSLSHCRVTRVWRYQSVRQLVSQSENSVK